MRGAHSWASLAGFSSGNSDGTSDESWLAFTLRSLSSSPVKPVIVPPASGMKNALNYRLFIIIKNIMK